MPHADALIRTFELSGGIQGRISDMTSHYFGGYYHVRISIRAEIPLPPSVFSDDVEYRNALTRLGPAVCFSRDLEKMAVPEDGIAEVRRQLLESFDTSMLPYLQKDGFCERFVLSEYRRSLKSRPGFRN